MRKQQVTKKKMLCFIRRMTSRIAKLLIWRKSSTTLLKISRKDLVNIKKKRNRKRIKFSIKSEKKRVLLTENTKNLKLTARRKKKTWRKALLSSALSNKLISWKYPLWKADANNWKPKKLLNMLWCKLSSPVIRAATMNSRAGTKKKKSKLIQESKNWRANLVTQLSSIRRKRASLNRNLSSTKRARMTLLKIFNKESTDLKLSMAKWWKAKILKNQKLKETTMKTWD